MTTVPKRGSTAQPQTCGFSRFVAKLSQFLGSRVLSPVSNPREPVFATIAHSRPEATKPATPSDPLLRLGWRSTSTAAMHSFIRPSTHVGLRLPSGILKIVEITPNQYVA